MDALSMDDWSLFAQAARNESALSQLFNRHRDYVYRLAWGLLNDPDAADDVVQDVFLKMRTGRLRAKPKAKFTTWLYQVAINTAREQARAKRKTWGSADSAEQLAARADDGTAMARIDNLEDLSAALAALPQRQREVIVLRLLEGFSTRETARIIGCREGTVKAHLHKATNRIRAIFGHV